MQATTKGGASPRYPDFQQPRPAPQAAPSARHEHHEEGYDVHEEGAINRHLVMVHMAHENTAATQGAVARLARTASLAAGTAALGNGVIAGIAASRGRSATAAVYGARAAAWSVVALSAMDARRKSHAAAELANRDAQEVARVLLLRANPDCAASGNKALA